MLFKVMDKYLQKEEKQEVIKEPVKTGYFKKGEDYKLRVTGVTMQEAVEILKKLSPRFVVGEEGGYQDVSLHIHAVVSPWPSKNMRNDIKKAFNKEAADYYWKKLRKSGCHAVRYVIKRGDPDYYTTHNVDQKKFELSCKMAHGKGRKSFAKDYEELKERFYRKEMTRYQFYKSIVKLKALYNQSIYAHHIKAQCITVFMKQDERYFDEWVNNHWETSGLMTRSEEREWNDKRYN